ncbi:glucosamine-6-phosphate deaminase [Paenibacillus sp. GCM10012307]|uniref:Glucosamine-6-phosphate deaminase n=1 Tax=Paenibacillus roseus TaxID=2798579 RepID=A0A934J834_9BACL|nr:glucosamine-6-phosphate deaminase [Paenibacillus roseus]MBJ6362023.1 glucosamine-6-phosphate deaminase [Paenibacillus roseus]
MIIKRFDRQEELDRYAAHLINTIVREKQHPVLGLATGSTPVGIYKAVIEEASRTKLSFGHVTTYNLDEYVGLAPDHEQSYSRYMNDHLFKHLDLGKGNTHLPDGLAADPEAECRRYDEMLAQQPLDVQLLGVGHNGHIGFNEPDAQLHGRTHVVKLKEETRKANARFFDQAEQVPEFAFTMGVGSILKAKMIILVARGGDKAAIVKKALQGPITTECPASLLQTHANVIVLLDADAGRDLIEDGTRFQLVHS